MSNQSVVIDLPEDIYNIYKQRAEQSQRSVEAEIAESLLKAAPQNTRPSNELDGLVAQLAFLDDKALKRLAKSRFPKKEAAQIEHLHFKQQAEGLNEVENSELAELMTKFDRWFVLRNEALRFLIERGFNPSEFSSK